jgi:ribosomal protein L16 Arg81 hydroxylase
LFCRALEKLLHHHVQTNLYLTPKAAQGFKPHYDTHDVFILQIAGSKHWRIYEPPLHLPHRSQPSNNAELLANPGALLMEFELQAGDCLYLPRGFVHEALTNEQAESLHITVGLTTFTYIEVLNEVINEINQSLKQEEIFRHSLPVSFTGQQPFEAAIKEKFLELVSQKLQASDLQQVAAKLHRRFIDNRAAVLDDYLVQLAALDNLTLNQLVQQRPANVYQFGKVGEQVSLSFSGKTITFPDYVEPSLRFVLAKDEEPFAIGEIDGVLNEDAKIVLVKRLIVEGFLRLV